jgi:phosphatidylinositol dimannoside acyltransferase
LTLGSRARVVLFKSLASLLEHLPERVDVAVASGVARAAGARQRDVRAALASNLARVLNPSGEVDADLLDRYTSRAFSSYGRYWAEGAKLPALAPTEVYRRFCISEGREHLDAAKERGRGLILALPHIGSWEWGGAYLAHLDLAMTAIAEQLEPPELFDWFRAKREAIGIRVAPLDEHAGTAMLATLREARVVGLLCDRDIQNNGVEVEFFHRRVTLPAGPATLALRTGATLLVAACYSGPGRDHHAVVMPAIETVREGRLRDDVQRVTQRVARELEGLIQRAPEQWHVLQPRFA